MNKKQRSAADNWYMTLAAIFIASLVTCNLIFLKFFAWQPIDSWDFTFQLSVGLLPYPITFLVTDLISEVYGKKKANRVVMSGFLASIFVVFVVWVADEANAATNVPGSLTAEEFHRVFGLNKYGVAASMIAYLSAQFVDIRIYHFWKKVTQGRMLWLRNNFSTFASQTIDTALVLVVLCFFGDIPWELFPDLWLMGVLFKVMIAAIDTPFLYLGVYFFRKKFNLQAGQELNY